MKAWYFSEVSCRLRHGDNRPIAAGVTHEVAGEPVLCERGLHASVRPIDALWYAPGPMIWRVELGGTIVKGDDKLCATERTYLWGFDATAMLREFARKCALDVIHLWAAPEVVKTYLKTGDESIRAAAGDAARAAAGDAAGAAARAAAGAAARAAAGAAAWAAAGAAAGGGQNKRLMSLIRKWRTK
ncbi:MAG: hypothetical protein KA329_12820 [Novosphingobium sp.]|nr:hypothetical protein [Novosphingobium sp.]